MAILDIFGQKRIGQKFGPDGPGIDKFETCLTPQGPEKIPEVIFEKMEKRQILTSNFGPSIFDLDF